MMSIIPAKDVGRVILEDLHKIAEREFPDATDAEREQMIAGFLNAWGGALFAGEMK